MMLLEETTVPTSALPVALFKDHLRLGSGFADDGVQDGLLAGFLRSALAAIEARTGKALMERTFCWTLTRWRNGCEQALPIAPVSAIVDLTVIDHGDHETEVARSRYQLRADMQRPTVLALSGALPAIPTGGSVRVRLLAGFGPEWSDLPADLAQAVMLLAAHYYEYRHELHYDGGCMPFGVSALIERYRSLRLLGGGAA